MLTIMIISSHLEFAIMLCKHLNTYRVVASLRRSIIISFRLVAFMACRDNANGAIIKASNFAAIKHRNQRRKDADKTPYINHPIGVAYILSDEGQVVDPAIIQVRIQLIIYLVKT